MHRAPDPQLDSVRGWVNPEALISDRRRVYTAEPEESALAKLADFERKWCENYPMLARAGGANWERARLFFAFAHEVRRISYTTNAIESLNFSLRKVTKV